MKNKIFPGIMIVLLSVVCAGFIGSALHLMFSGRMTEIINLNHEICVQMIISEPSARRLFVLTLLLLLIAGVYILLRPYADYRSGMMRITPDIEIPIPAGEKQHGSARFLTDIECKRLFGYADTKKPISRGGILVGADERNTNKVYYVSNDAHTLCIGGTGSGKTRRCVLESICLQALAGEGMVLSDPKGELHQYTYPFLKELGYNVITLDYKTPRKSNRYNPLQNVIDAVKDEDLERAKECALDITESLCGKAEGEKIWKEGEKSIIASSILAVVYDNRDAPEFQNLTNVNFFIGEMGKKLGTDSVPLVYYANELSDTHPVRGTLNVSEVAAERTRSSFYASALTTLRLFQDSNMYNITSDNDFLLKDTVEEKTAIFIILPDEKPTYYSLASLFVTQYYEFLVKYADDRGGRLPRRVNFNLDEFGNFTTIPAMDTKITVARSRGVRFNLFIQALSQLDEKYGKEIASIIQSNCDNLIYLSTGDQATQETISKRLDEYTVSTNSKSTSYNGTGHNGNYSASSNLSGRKLLTPGEVGKIKLPYSLAIYKNEPAIMYMPDLTKYVFNEQLGLGDEKHNTRVREQRENERPVRSEKRDMKLWGIWYKYTDPVRWEQINFERNGGSNDYIEDGDEFSFNDNFDTKG